MGGSTGAGLCELPNPARIAGTLRAPNTVGHFTSLSGLISLCSPRSVCFPFVFAMSDDDDSQEFYVPSLVEFCQRGESCGVLAVAAEVLIRSAWRRQSQPHM